MIKNAQGWRNAGMPAHPAAPGRTLQAMAAAPGSPNAEIAATLVLSTRTVDHHVSAVLATLGTPTRAAVHATRLGLTGTPAARP